MAYITQVRGALLEEAVLYLLSKVGYEPVIESRLATRPIHGLRVGRSGVEVRGRGAWHQIDAIALCTHSPAFLYPLRLLVEAKFYGSTKVGVEVLRNAVGVITDISQNHFSIRNADRVVQAPRFNFSGVVVSPTGFSSAAAEYALAHQIFLLEYSNLPVVQPLIDAIGRLTSRDVDLTNPRCVRAARRVLRAALNQGNEPFAAADDDQGSELVMQSGRDLIERSVQEAVRRVGGSYFGMLQGRWPLHLMLREELPANAFAQDVVPCRVVGDNEGVWRFSPTEFRPGHDGYFEIEFRLPPAVARLVAEQWDDSFGIVDLKQNHFSYIDITGNIGGIRRNVRLTLDERWIDRYVQGLGQHGQ